MIPGAESLVAELGSWPDFHDAEVLELVLRREGVSCLVVQPAKAGGIPPEKAAAPIRFSFEGIVDLELADFSSQNVIASLVCLVTANGWRVTLSPCFGLAGYIEARSVAVSGGEPN